MTEPAYLFSDPFGNRNNEIKGRPGISDRWAEGLTSGLLALNVIHEEYLTPQTDLSPVVEALRTATPTQVEGARHLMIHALEMLKEAAWSREYSLSSPRRVKSERLHWEARGPWPAWRPKVDEAYLDESMTTAPTPVEAFVRAAKEVLVAAPAAFKAFRSDPTNAGRGRAVTELALALADGRIVMDALAGETGDPAAIAAAETMRIADEEFGSRLETFRNGVGEEYRDSVTSVIPSRGEIQAKAQVNVRLLGEIGAMGHARNVKRCIDSLGGGRDDRTVRWAFNRRTHDRSSSDDKFLDPMPNDLTETEARFFQGQVADLFEHYQRMNHVAGFTGYVKQVLFAHENRTHSRTRPAMACGLRSLVERVGVRLGGPAPKEGIRLAFQQVEGEEDVLVGGFKGAPEDAPLVIAYLRAPTVSIASATRLVVAPASFIENGIPAHDEVEEQDVRPVGGSHFMNMADLIASLTDPKVQAMMFPEYPVVGLEFDDEPFVATLQRAPVM